MKLNIDKLDEMTGDDIRALRQHLGQTQTEFAKTMNGTLVTVGRWERNEIAIAAPAARLAQLLAVLRPVVELLHSD